jgi:hypothetical protein
MSNMGAFLPNFLVKKIRNSSGVIFLLLFVFDSLVFI